MNLNYQIHRNFLSEKDCQKLLDHSIKNFEVDWRIRQGWHAKTNTDKKFEYEVKKLFKEIVTFEDYEISWINLSEYENNRGLKLHKDGESQLTLVCVLTNNFIGGNFLVEDQKIDLKIGDVVLFNGGNMLHGVEPVTEGYRASFNIWFTNKTKKLI